jgi:hypothetical protein
MGAETHHYTHNRPYTPSRISNCGGMVAEEVVRQMEEELRQQAALRCSWLQAPGSGRKLLVGMKLTTNSCREMLNWTIDKVAQPGDQILALHVPSSPLPSGYNNSVLLAYLYHLLCTIMQTPPSSNHPECRFWSYSTSIKGLGWVSL